MPDLNSGSILIGTPGISGWRTGFTNPVPDLPGNTVDGISDLSYGVNSAAGGDHVIISSDLANFDFTDGGTVSVNFTNNNHTYDPSKIDFNDLIVSWGYSLDTSLRPDPDQQIGSYSVIPEPQTTGLAAALVSAVTLLVLRRRLKTV
jgi:hypothetical protein